LAYDPLRGPRAVSTSPDHSTEPSETSSTTKWVGFSPSTSRTSVPSGLIATIMPPSLRRRLSPGPSKASVRTYPPSSSSSANSTFAAQPTVMYQVSVSVDQASSVPPPGEATTTPVAFDPPAQ
jgi:hypothetical protein